MIASPENPVELQECRKFAVQTAQRAGRLLMRNYGKMQKLEWVLKTNFKTEVDTKSDNLIRAAISKKFPGHNIFSEENLAKDSGSELSWVVDPLDGTIPYRYGINDHFAVCLGLIRFYNPILGVIYAPKRKELYEAAQGQGAFLNGRPISVSQETNINHVLMGVDSGKLNRTASLGILEKLRADDGIACDFAGGCASIPLSFVAAGRLHAYLATSLEPWDMTAAVIIIREAGGKVTNLEGENWNLQHQSILAANPILHGKILDFLRTH